MKKITTLITGIVIGILLPKRLTFPLIGIVITFLCSCAVFRPSLYDTTRSDHPLRKIGLLLREEKFEEAKKLLQERKTYKVRDRWDYYNPERETMTGKEIIAAINEEQARWSDNIITFRKVKSLKGADWHKLTSNDLPTDLDEMCRDWPPYILHDFMETYSPMAVCKDKVNHFAEIETIRRHVEERERMMSLEEREALEKKRMSKPCRLAEMEEQICTNQEALEMSKKSIERQKEIGEVSGYVNKVVMHDSGSIIISAEKNMTRLNAQYRSLTGHIFDTSLCKDRETMEKKRRNACGL